MTSQQGHKKSGNGLSKAYPTAAKTNPSLTAMEKAENGEHTAIKRTQEKKRRREEEMIAASNVI